MTAIDRANANAHKVLQEGECSKPIMKCVKVPSGEFEYWPSCALLHKCGDDAGCCSNAEHSCMAVQTEIIELYFYFMKVMSFFSFTKKLISFIYISLR